MKDLHEELRERIFAALMGALAVALPQVFHLVGLGATFLPMHLPILLAGFVARAGLAASVGLLAPLLSFLIVGMPPAPLLPVMMVELAVLGGAAALLHRRLRLPVWVALPGAIAARVGVSFALLSLLGDLLRLPRFESAAAWLLTGTPGVLLQLVAVPLALRALQRRRAARPASAP